jgi:hypothetical protein
MTKLPNPNQIQMTKFQIPKGNLTRVSLGPTPWALVIGVWDLIGIWILGHWDFHSHWDFRKQAAAISPQRCGSIQSPNSGIR